MRVITGVLRGKRLITVPGNDLVRPTTEKVKEAIFSSVQFDIEGRNVLDLFAGSGQMGIEALSRGADNATFVDASKVSINTVKQNLKDTPFEKTAKIVNRDFLSFLKTCDQRFDIVFIDPPYDAGLVLTALSTVAPLVNPCGTVFCEHPLNTEMPEEIGGLVFAKEYKYGRIAVTSYKKGAE